MHTKRFALSLFLFALVALLPLARGAESGGSVTGTVSNTATGNLLEGVRVEIAAQGLSVLTDDTGRYVLPVVAAGSHEVTVSYIGLDTAKAQVVVSAGQRAVRNFDLTTALYQLDAFKVTGEREGGAAAITAQRNAENLKNVVAMDSYGNLPNMNAGEVDPPAWRGGKSERRKSRQRLHDPRHGPGHELRDAGWHAAHQRRRDQPRDQYQQSHGHDV